MGWLMAWWDAIRRRPSPDPWNDDPEIRRERERQHDEGVTDAAQAYRLREQLRARRIEMHADTWRRQASD